MSFPSLEEEGICAADEVTSRSFMLEHINLLEGCIWSEKHALTEYLKG
jgi:hypothetical protein